MTKRRRKLLTGRQLAVELATTAATINRWAAEGMPVKVRGRGGRPNRYELSPCRAWLDARRQASPDGAPVDLARSRARREEAQAKLIEQTTARRAGKLLDADEVEKMWSREVASVRSLVLASYGPAAAERVCRASVTDGVAGVEQELKRIAYETLRELANPERPPAQQQDSPS